MPVPSNANVRFRPDLAGSLMEFDLAQSQAGFVGLQVMPAFDVKAKGGPFGVVPLKQLLAERETLRAPRTGYSRGDFQFEQHTWTCQEYGAEEPIDDAEAAMYGEYQLDMVSAQRARDVVLRGHERRVAAKLFDASAHTATAAGATWNDLAAADPLVDVEAAVNRLYDKGIIANAIVMSRRRFRQLRLTSAVQDVLASQGAGTSFEPGRITQVNLQTVFDLPRIIVAGALRNAANPGQDASLSSIWSDDIVAVVRVAETQDHREHCFGRTFHFGEDGSQIGTLFEQYRDETVRADIIRNRFDVDENVISSAAVELITGVDEAAGGGEE